MSFSVTRFRIEGLHNFRTVDILIEDNKLVLVGENGTGKSTVVNFVYFLLTEQWHRMLDTIFKSVSVEIDGNNYTFDLEYIKLLANESQYRRRTHRLPAAIYREFEELSFQDDADIDAYLSRLSRAYGIPLRILRNELTRAGDIYSELREKANALREAVSGNVLYLPTYRRIEQDLETILPNIDTDQLRRARREGIGYNRRRGNIELVEFGMEDVARTLHRRMNSISEKVRQDLSTLTGAYLRDIIQGAYKTIPPDQLVVPEDYRIGDILRRIPDVILPADDKQTLKEIIEEISRRGAIDDDNRVVAHFLTKLVEFYVQQQEDERDLREFVAACNSYLSGKEFVYDDVSFDIFVQQESDESHSRRIPLQALSSGEKQIVSLFSHLYLASESDYFVIIDEPELSLSVPWQHNFLPDILKRSSGLVAVTHSPFIYDNELKPYAHSLEEFSQPFEYDPDIEPQVSDEDIPF